MNNMYTKELNLLKEVLPKLYQDTLKQTKDIKFKGPEDMVTSSDLYIESNLIKAIKEAFPTDTFLSEEFHSKAELINRTWIIDPIDGTSNYGVSLNLFVMQVALYDQNDIILSVIYYPSEHKFYYAIKGHGAYLNDQRYYVDSLFERQNDMLSMVGYTIRSTEKKYYTILLKHAIDKHFKLRMLGSIGLELMYVSTGVFTVFYSNIKNLWDLAPGVLLAKEAKAYLFNEKGLEYQLGDEHLFITKTKKLKNEIIDCINK